MVKIVEPMVGLLTNSEVLRVLHDRGADGQRPGNTALPVEKMAYHYLTTHSAGVREPQALQDFMKLLEPFKLVRSEQLAIINTCPTSAVEVFLLVDDCEARLSEAQVEQILDLVAMHLKH
uniref:DNA-directed RNA polymerase III subunit RPC9 n=1 Tax=Chlamydomonas leiostraca TaxID=1034604 RepID=A0A7S0RHE0_9CHLO|mmetsp:Transcript_22641/g.57640  ORF Transcript_22641/g.57640 Transcript_22641/m.57640 type:complete len:120 (+) Transcript_22641:53-412(+)|eukprot:CAMPEP_0202866972 /NCGR_PEP_ID=MMETSP1391-20130828/8458_1 /ASSEMBLY_ACC=CAM_ASM_000867 /TAXON_ID=1034604 /ORGANISM="Chlamydomonas leiostraca, Strain SAG 11-49" /LENGTH=119 /DNA_ID=CAMNT_0049546965 /DNA_START=50 /DNA_END=409 /DNA_ORIENTATION=+